MNQLRCKVCFSRLTKSTSVTVKNGYYINRCLNCDFIFVSNPPSEEYLKDFYRNFKYKEELDLEARIRKDARRSLKVINKFIHPPGTLLDVGCGRGYFLDEAKMYDWNTFGIDYSKRQIDYAKNVLKLNAEVGDVLSYKINKKFSLITINQVIEHVLNPKKLVRKCYQLLDTHGFLYIATPNIESLTSKVFEEKFEHLTPPEHLSFFSKKTLEKLLKDNGFMVVYLGSWSYPENLAGIIKKLFKTNFEYYPNKEGSRSKEPKLKGSLASSIKYVFFDQLFCKIFYRLLEIDSLGINLEIIAKKTV